MAVGDGRVTYILPVGMSRQLATGVTQNAHFTHAT